MAILGWGFFLLVWNFSLGFRGLIFSLIWLERKIVLCRAALMWIVAWIRPFISRVRVDEKKPERWGCVNTCRTCAALWRQIISNSIENNNRNEMLKLMEQNSPILAPSRSNCATSSIRQFNGSVSFVDINEALHPSIYDSCWKAAFYCRRKTGDPL